MRALVPPVVLALAILFAGCPNLMLLGCPAALRDGAPLYFVRLRPWKMAMPVGGLAVLLGRRFEGGGSCKDAPDACLELEFH